MAVFRITQVCEVYNDEGALEIVLEPGTLVTGHTYGEGLVAEIEGCEGGECWLIEPEYFKRADKIEMSVARKVELFDKLVEWIGEHDYEFIDAVCEKVGMSQVEKELCELHIF